MFVKSTEEIRRPTRASGRAFGARMRPRRGYRSREIADARFVGIHYPLRREASAAMDDSASSPWMCVCGTAVPRDYLQAGVTDSASESRGSFEPADEEAFYAFPEHAECTARSLQRPGVEAQVFLAARSDGTDVVAHLWCSVCGDLGATAARANSDREIVLRFGPAHAGFMSYSAVRDLVMEHEESCGLLRRYNLAVHPERSTWKSPDVRFAEFIASLDGSTLRDELTFRVHVEREVRS